MPVEAATYINDLNVSNPLGGDPRAEGDNHLRLLKTVLKATFPNATGPITFRERLTANRTYYVRADGNNANTGLVDSAAGAWATLQKAYDYISQFLDISTYQVTVQIGVGTFAGLLAQIPLIGGGAGNLVFRGDTVTPANVVISSSVIARQGASFTLSGIQVNGGAGNGIEAESGSRILISNIRFGAAVNHMLARERGAIEIVGNYETTGNFTSHLAVNGDGIILVDANSSATINGAPTFTTFAIATGGGKIYVPNAFTYGFVGAGTGQRYLATRGGLIDWAAGSETSFPGTTAGTATDGGSVTFNKTSGLGAGAFNVHRNGVNQTGLVAGAFNKITFTTEEFDLDGDFDPATSTYTARRAGLYHFMAQAAVQHDAAAGAGPQLDLRVSTVSAKRGSNHITAAGVNGIGGASHLSALVSLAAGATVELYVYCVGANGLVVGTAAETQFSGYRVRDT